jgi:hypothetical protein
MVTAEGIEITALITELGPLIAAAEVRQYDRTVWALATEDDFVVAIEGDEAGERLFLTTELGRPAAEQASAIFQQALEAGSRAPATSNRRLGLTMAGDELTLIDDLEVARLTLESMSTALLDFLQEARQRRAALTGVTETPIDALAPSEFLIRP